VKKWYLLSVMVCLVVAGCAFVQQRLAIKNCTFKLVNAQARNFTLTDMSVDLKLAAYNPNPINVAIDRLDLTLLINDQRTVKANFSGTTITAQQSQYLTTTVVVPYMSAGMAIIEILRKNEPVRYRLDGDIYMNTPIGMINFPVTIYESK
jgi:LEA14-like dessication related protein